MKFTRVFLLLFLLLILVSCTFAQNGQYRIPPQFDLSIVPGRSNFILFPPWGYYEKKNYGDEMIIQYAQRYTVQQMYYGASCDPDRYPLTLTWRQLSLIIGGAVDVGTGGAATVPEAAVAAVGQIVVDAARDELVNWGLAWAVGGWLDEDKSLFRVGYTCILAPNPVPMGPIQNLDVVPYQIVIHRRR